MAALRRAFASGTLLPVSGLAWTATQSQMATILPAEGNADSSSDPRPIVVGPEQSGPVSGLRWSPPDSRNRRCKERK